MIVKSLPRYSCNSIQNNRSGEHHQFTCRGTNPGFVHDKAPAPISSPSVATTVSFSLSPRCNLSTVPTILHSAALHTPSSPAASSHGSFPYFSLRFARFNQQNLQEKRGLATSLDSINKTLTTKGHPALGLPSLMPPGKTGTVPLPSWTLRVNRSSQTCSLPHPPYRRRFYHRDRMRMQSIRVPDIQKMSRQSAQRFYRQPLL